MSTGPNREFDVLFCIAIVVKVIVSAIILYCLAMKNFSELFKISVKGQEILSNPLWGVGI